MKQNLGKLIVLFIYNTLLLCAEDFVYDFYTNSHTPYVKEPILLSIDINQSNPDVVLFFQFKIKKNSAYSVKQIVSSQNHTLHHTKIHYRYLIYPLRSGDINITFDLTKRVTNDESVAYSFSGDRDDFKKLETVDTQININPITLHVKSLPKKTQLIGNYNLSYTINKHKVQSYEPISMNVIIQGEGYPPLVKDIIHNEDNITLFKQAPILKQIIHPNSIYYKATYTMALSNDKSFNLSPITLHAFNPKTHEPYQLSIPAQQFTVTAVNTNTLVDKINSPKPLNINFSWIKTFLGYLTAFIAGYASALLLKRKKQKIIKSNNPLKQKIENAKNEKILLQLLLSTDNICFKDAIEHLESSLYGDGKINLKKIKKDILEQL